MSRVFSIDQVFYIIDTFISSILAPCILPQIQNGQYLSGYRAGLTIVNGSSVNFYCDDGFLKSAGNQIQCILGKIFPHNPSCKPHIDITVNMSKMFDSPHYLGGRDIIKGGDITQLGYGTSVKSCGPPAKLVYRFYKKNFDKIETILCSFI